jgi:beta-glucosidase
LRRACWPAFGAASGTGTITYTDGTTQQYSLVMTDWYNNAPVPGNQIATTTASWNLSSSTQVTHPVSIYFASVPLHAGKTVASPPCYPTSRQFRARVG